MILDEAMVVHNTLNPKIWESNNEMRPEVKEKLLNIVEYFKSTLDIEMHIIDVIVVGSNASYNYTEFSDLDLHIITNSEFLHIPSEIAQVLYNSFKTKFNNDYDISVHGVEVELYIEDVKTNVTSNGIYSVLHEKWIKFPKPIEVKQVDVEDILKKWRQKLDTVLLSDNPEDISSAIDTLYLIRRNSISNVGEYGRGNQLFKQLRNEGYFERLRDRYKELKSDELSLENLKLDEDSRMQIINKSKSSPDGLKRFKNRMKSKVATGSAKYNNINMDKLFKDNILTVDVEVAGQTDTYIVKVSFGGFLDILYDQIKDGSELDLRKITRSLITGFNRNDVYIHCSCPDFKYTYSYYATRNDINSGQPENRPSDERNPNDKKGSGCKHSLRVLSNTSWLLKVAIVIWNYIKYMKKHEEKLYQDIIYPAIYKTAYVEDAVDVDIEDTENTEQDSTISSESADEQ